MLVTLTTTLGYFSIWLLKIRTTVIFSGNYKGLFTWKEEDPSTRKIREGGKTFRLLYMQKFRPKWLPSGEGKEGKLTAFSS